MFTIPCGRTSCLTENVHLPHKRLYASRVCKLLYYGILSLCERKQIGFVIYKQVLDNKTRLLASQSCISCSLNSYCYLKHETSDVFRKT